jgi:Family of unknown function (DUF5996)
MGAPERAAWPALHYEEWKDTYATLRMWMQVVGKVALAQAPPINHSWAVEAAFYAYAVLEPAGLKDAAVQPSAAYYHRELGEFILPYEAVRTGPDPTAAIRTFIGSTYDRAATLGRWDRAALERPVLAV